MQTETNSNYFEARQQALLEKIDDRKLSALVVTKPENIFYLTGFRGSAGAAIWARGGNILLVDPRYTLQAREQAYGMEVAEVRDGLLRGAGKRLKKLRGKGVGFEESFLTCAQFQILRKQAPLSLVWKGAGGIVENLRTVKDDLEIQQIRKACQLTSEVLEETAQQLRPGIQERDLSAELEFRMRRQGAEGMAFETIVASGSRAALPHAHASAKLLGPGEWVIFDLGAVCGGYMADMTRTFYLGRPPRRMRSLYQSVLAAQEQAIETLRAGVKAQDVDAAARRTLKRRGLDKFFTHSTGHGVGIEIHERPRLGKGEKTKIPVHSVLTVEPGIYVESVGGIRIEDTLLVSEKGSEILTPARKDRWWIE